MALRPILIDCDTGIDDALALLMISHWKTVEVLGVTTVAGNVSLENTTRNTCNVLHAFGRDDIPVASGEAKPLERNLTKASGVHGITGLRGWEPEEEYQKNLLKGVHAIDFIHDTLMKEERKVTLVVLGPITNIALLLRKYPEVKERIEEIIFMGTSWHDGNPTPVATFNVLVDPEAFREVLFSGIRIVSCPLDTVRKAPLPLPDMEEIATYGTKLSTFATAVFSGYGLAAIKKDEVFDKEGEEELSASRIERVKKETKKCLPDPMTMAYVMAPELFKGNLYYCDVECKGELTTGMTLVDKAGYYLESDKPKNLFFLEEVDEKGFIDLFKSCCKAY